MKMYMVIYVINTNVLTTVHQKRTALVSQEMITYLNHVYVEMVFMVMTVVRCLVMLTVLIMEVRVVMVYVNVHIIRAGTRASLRHVRTFVVIMACV